MPAEPLLLVGLASVWQVRLAHPSTRRLALVESDGDPLCWKDRQGRLALTSLRGTSSSAG